MYFGRCFLIRLHSRISASISLSTVMYSNSLIWLTMLLTFGSMFRDDWKYWRTRLRRLTALPT